MDQEVARQASSRGDGVAPDLDLAVILDIELRLLVNDSDQSLVTRPYLPPRFAIARARPPQ